MRYEAGLQIPGQGGQLQRGHDRPVVRTFGREGLSDQLSPDPTTLFGREDEEVGQLTDTIAQDGAGVADDVLGAIDGNPCVIGRGREVLEEGLEMQPRCLAGCVVRGVDRIGRPEPSVDLGE